MAEQAVKKYHAARILTIESHVVHGFAGNKCCVLPLQMLGFDVDFINSVQFSNHAGTVEYSNFTTRYKTVKGEVLNDSQLAEIFEGLKQNDLIEYSYLLTGYCGNISFLRKIADIVTALKALNPKLTYVCDPVMGDNGRYYTPPELLPVYRDIIVPLADVLCPNAFEIGFADCFKVQVFSELTGLKVTSEETCLKAIDIVHAKGVPIVIVTSGVETSDTHLRCYASSKGISKRFRFTFPRIPGQFVGTGDVFAALLLAHLHDTKMDIENSVKRVLGSMHYIIKNTAEYVQSCGREINAKTCELRLIQSRYHLICPPSEEAVKDFVTVEVI